MKKIYTTLMLVLIASISFAQISTLTLKDSGDHYPVKKRTMNTLERAGAGSWWIDYSEDLRAYMGLETLEYGGVVFLQDSADADLISCLAVAADTDRANDRRHLPVLAECYHRR